MRKGAHDFIDTAIADILGRSMRLVRQCPHRPQLPQRSASYSHLLSNCLDVDDDNGSLAVDILGRRCAPSALILKFL